MPIHVLQDGEVQLYTNHPKFPAPDPARVQDCLLDIAANGDTANKIGNPSLIHSPAVSCSALAASASADGASPSERRKRICAMFNSSIAASSIDCGISPSAVSGAVCGPNSLSSARS